MEQDPLSPEDRALFNELLGVIHEELNVCFTMGRFDEPNSVEVTADLSIRSTRPVSPSEHR